MPITRARHLVIILLAVCHGIFAIGLELGNASLPITQVKATIVQNGKINHTVFDNMTSLLRSVVWLMCGCGSLITFVFLGKFAVNRPCKLINTLFIHSIIVL